MTRNNPHSEETQRVLNKPPLLSGGASPSSAEYDASNLGPEKKSSSAEYDATALSPERESGSPGLRGVDLDKLKTRLNEVEIGKNMDADKSLNLFNSSPRSQTQTKIGIERGVRSGKFTPEDVTPDPVKGVDRDPDDGTFVTSYRTPVNFKRDRTGRFKPDNSGTAGRR